MDEVIIDAEGVYYRQLNDRINEEIEKGAKHIVVKNVRGQRYIGAGIKENVRITVEGVAGNDLGVFMSGPFIEVTEYAQDGVSNTMNEGTIVVYGHAGDVLGYGMRGGKLFVLGDVGYRVGIHMKEYGDKIPVIVVGGTAGDFFGEYMAGGILVLLGLDSKSGSDMVGSWLGTGMHGGRMYIRRGDDIPKHKIGAEVGFDELNDWDKEQLEKNVREFCSYFNINPDEILKDRFVKLYPKSKRPYGRLYAY